MSGTELVTNAAADPLRIVLVAPPYFDIPPKGYGGTEAVVADLADALVKRGHDVTVLGAGEPRTSARLIPVWERTLADRLGEPYPEIMHALKVRRVIERIATTDGVDIVHDHTFAGPLNTPAYSAVGIPMVVTVHGPIDDDLYPYYRVLGDEVGLIAISDRQRELAPDLNWVGRVHNALRIDEWPFRADKGDYALFLGRYAPYKGAHLALRAAHQAGIPLVLAGKCNEPPEHAYFNEQVRPLLTENDHVYGQVDAVSKREIAGRRPLPTVPDSVGGAVWDGDDRGDGVWHTGGGAARRRGTGGDRRRCDRRGVRPARRATRGNRAGTDDGPGGVPAARSRALRDRRIRFGVRADLSDGGRHRRVCQPTGHIAAGSARAVERRGADNRMTAPPTPFNSGDPVNIGFGGDTVTLVEGATFCLSDGRGDVLAGRSHGLFVRDARVLSRWELRVDGQPAEPLSVQAPEPFVAKFILRRSPRAGLADSTLLLVRERLIADGLRETISLHNLDDESTVVALMLHADADFADLFSVKEGRAPLGGADMTVRDDELVLTDRTDRIRGVTVTASGDPIVLPGSLNWRIVVPPRQSWQAEIVVQPTWANQNVKTRFRSGEHQQSSGPAHKIEAWRDTATKLEAEHPALTQILRRSESDLGALLIHDDTEDGPPFVAAGAPWFMTLFGRDSLLTAWMALPLDVGVSVGTLQQLAEAQGRRVDPITEEQPGRILHEIRGGPASTDVLGGTIYYGSVDSTPLFVMLLAECWRWGADEDFVRSLLPAADAALAWAKRYGDRDGDGFIEYRRATDRGLINQGWKDSFDGINDATGHTADPPIAVCEVQGYQYAALLARAELADAFGEPGTAARAARARRRVAGAVPRRVLAARAGLVCDRAGRSQTPYRRVDQQRRPLPVDGDRDRRARRGDRRPAVPRGDGLRIRPTHTGDDDGRLQPDELPQRLGLAA